jgi:hypothetical protein
MSGSAAAGIPLWSRQRWLLSILLALTVQTGLILWLAERPKPAAAPADFPTVIQLVGDEAAAQRLSELPALNDPTVFALPSPHGFSGRAWLKFTPPQYELTDWVEPNRWLEPDAARLGEAFTRFVNANHSPPLRIADKPAPKNPLDDLTVPALPLATNSAYRITGDLAPRTLLAPPELTPWPHTEILNPTEVQLFVNAEGFPVSTVLWAESGSRAADEHALELARATRFAPLRGSPGEKPPRAATLLTRGKIIFFWHTKPLPGTNAPAFAP